MKKILTLLLAAASLTACDIDRLPYNSMAAEQITNDPSASLESLMNGMYAQLKTWSDPMHRCGEYAGDNMMIRGSSTDAFYEFISFSRTPVNYRLQNFWDYGYKAVAQASNIIKMIEEGQSAEIDNQLGECYYVRGMMYFYLCRAYGRPYYQAPDKNLGVPIVNGTPDDIMGDLLLPDRSTVKLKLPLHAIAMLPSTFNTSSWRVISTSSSFGQGASRQSTPSPTTPRLNSPSFPATAEERLERITALCFSLASHARNNPSSNTMEPFQSFKSTSRMCL